MSDPHRDELEAAYERIAALEAKIEELTAPPPDERAEEVIALERRLAHVKAHPPTWEPTVLAAPVAFVLLALAISAARDLGLMAIFAVVAVVAFLLARKFVKDTMLVGHRRSVAEAEKELEQARVRVRIETDDPQETETEEEPESEARGERGG